MLLLTMLGSSGCFYIDTHPPPLPPTPIPGWDANKYQAQKMVAALAERDKRLVSVESPAVMEYTVGTQHVKAKEQIVARRPGSLRVEASSPFGVALLIAAQGTDLQSSSRAKIASFAARRPPTRFTGSCESRWRRRTPSAC